MLTHVMLSVVIEYCHAEGHNPAQYAECHNAQCPYTECHYAECRL